MDICMSEKELDRLALLQEISRARLSRVEGGSSDVPARSKTVWSKNGAGPESQRLRRPMPIWMGFSFPCGDHVSPRSLGRPLTHTAPATGTTWMPSSAIRKPARLATITRLPIAANATKLTNTASKRDCGAARSSLRSASTEAAKYAGGDATSGTGNCRHTKPRNRSRPPSLAGVLQPQPPTNPIESIPGARDAS